MGMGVLTFTGGGSIPKTVGNTCIFITANELLPNIQNKINELHLIHKVKRILGVGEGGAEWWCRLLVIVTNNVLKNDFVLHHRDVLTSGLSEIGLLVPAAPFLCCSDKWCYFLLLPVCLPTSCEPGNQSGSL